MNQAIQRLIYRFNLCAATVRGYVKQVLSSKQRTKLQTCFGALNGRQLDTVGELKRKNNGNGPPSTMLPESGESLVDSSAGDSVEP